MEQPTQEESTNLQQPVQPTQPEPQTQQPIQHTTGTKYAGFWIRFVALIIDGLVLLIPQAIVGFILSMIGFGSESIVARAFTFLITWTYYIAMTNKYQATLGKKAVGIKVISDKSDNLNLTQIVIRETIGKLVSLFTFTIGYIIAGFTAKKQGLHDFIASTTVVYNDPNKKTSVWIIVLVLILPILAVIGILAGIVLVSLQATRDKANEAAIKATLEKTMPVDRDIEF